VGAIVIEFRALEILGRQVGKDQNARLRRTKTPAGSRRYGLRGFGLVGGIVRARTYSGPNCGMA